MKFHSVNPDAALYPLTQDQRSKLEWSLVTMILVFHAALVLQSAWIFSPTVDEISHLPAGLSHLQFRRFDLYRVNPPLVQGWAAIPLLFTDHREDWKEYSFDKTRRAEFSIGKRFVNANKADSVRLYRIGRAACLPFSLIGALTAYCFARRIYGIRAGFIALALWSFSPNIIGNAAIITPDVPAAALSILAAYRFWIWLSTFRISDCAFTGIVLGLALTTKMTCLFLCIAFLCLWLFTLVKSSVQNLRTTGLQLLQLCLIFAIALVVINNFYLWDGTGRCLENERFVSKTLGGPNASPGNPNNRFVGTFWGRIPIPIPTDYLHGLDLQKADFESARWSYVAGTHKLGGWWWWYFYATGVKAMDGTVFLALMAVVSLLRSSSKDLSLRSAEWAVIILGVLVFILVSSQWSFSRYLRYLLPAAPFLFVWIGRVGMPTMKSPIWLVCVYVALVFNVIDCLNTHPNHLSYFNRLSGTSKNGHYHLLDANIDWGQSSLQLSHWIKRNVENQDVYVSLFAPRYSMDLTDLGIEAKQLPITRMPGEPMAQISQLNPIPEGIYAISVNHLHAYRHQTIGDPDCSQFLNLKPIARIGNAIYIYRITQGTSLIQYNN